MADNKKYLDLSGLGYAIRKMDSKKADLESPVFTGTPKIGEDNITTQTYVNNNFVNKTDKIEQSEIENIFGEPEEAPKYAMKDTVDALVQQIEELTSIVTGIQDYEARIQDLERKTADIEVENV